MAFRIVFVEGPDKGASHPLRELMGTVVGRSPTSHVHVRDRNVSRAHCQLRLLEDECTIEDLGSTNGTFVNGLRITESALKPDDLVALGETKFRLLNEEDEDADDSTVVMADGT